MYIRKRLLIVGLVLFLVALSCFASAQGQSSESEEALAKFQACSDDFADRGFAGITYLDCLESLNVSELEAFKEHDFCLASPECLVAVQSALDTFPGRATLTAEALPTLDSVGDEDSLEHGSGDCTNLTLEECANAGGHLFAMLDVGRDTGRCNYYDRPVSEEWREITFENGKFKLEGYTGEGYDGHTRIAENTYQWVNPDGKSIETVTFTLNGQVVVDEWVNGDCIWDITYTLKE